MTTIHFASCTTHAKCNYYNAFPMPASKLHSSRLFSRTTWVSWHQEGQTNLDFIEARDDGGGSGISWTVCKSFAPHFRLTTPAPHHSILYRCSSSCPHDDVKALKAIWTTCTSTSTLLYKQVSYHLICLFVHLATVHSSNSRLLWQRPCYKLEHDYIAREV